MHKWIIAWLFSAYALHSVAIADEQTPGAAEGERVRAALASEWNLGNDAVKACKTPLTLRIYLEPDGVVRDVKLVDPQGFEAGDSCEQAAEAAKRGVLAASPLWLPKPTPSLTITFDSTQLQ